MTEAIATGPAEGPAWWWLGTLVIERSPQPGPGGNRAGAVVLEATVPLAGHRRCMHDALEDAWYRLSARWRCAAVMRGSWLDPVPTSG